MSEALPETFVDTPAEEEAQDLLKRLVAQTAPSSKNATRPPLYNAPDLWYARPDGDIVKLQGDAASQAYYRSKGFHILTPAEVREWEGAVRPLVIREQRKRAQLITTLRRIAARHPGVDLAGDMEITPTEELEEMLQQVKTMTGGNVAVVMGRFREEQPPVDISDVQLSSGAELEAKLSRESAVRAEGRPRDGYGRFAGAGSQV